jgi:hypothetical protein
MGEKKWGSLLRLLLGLVFLGNGLFLGFSFGGFLFLAQNLHLLYTPL